MNEGLPDIRTAFLRGAATSVARRGVVLEAADLPDDVLHVRAHPDPDRLTAYQHLVGEPARDVLPPGFVHVLTFPVSVALMTRSRFPLPILGLVHLSNRIEQHRPIGLEVLDIAVRATDLRPHRRGGQVDVVAEVFAGEEPVWRGTSTYLAKGVRVHGTPAAEAHPEFTPPRPDAVWRLGADLGRRYAKVSGDHNPIHKYRAVARAFGFRRPIAHGMYTAARALAPLRRPAAFRWEVSFARPVLLPGTAWYAADDDGHALWDPRTGKPHLTGSLTPV